MECLRKAFYESPSLISAFLKWREDTYASYHPLFFQKWQCSNKHYFWRHCSDANKMFHVHVYFFKFNEKAFVFNTSFTHYLSSSKINYHPSPCISAPFDQRLPYNLKISINDRVLIRGVTGHIYNSLKSKCSLSTNEICFTNELSENFLR